MGAADDLVRDYDGKMKKSLGVVQQELAGLRTGRASAALVENVKVDYYGTTMPVKQLASIGIPDAKTVEIRPWDKNALQPLEKALASSDLKLAPQRQGDLIRLIIPPLTQERRSELVKVAKRVAEEGRVAIRNLRHELNNRLKAAKDGEGLSEDDFRKFTAQAQRLTDVSIAKIDELLSTKEKEITTI